MSAGAKLIRRHVAEGLEVFADLNAKVFAARHRALQKSDVPAVLVYTDKERVLDTTASTFGARKYEREIELHLAIVANTRGQNDDGDLIADELDDIAEIVERWMFEREENEPVWVEAKLQRTGSGTADEADFPAAIKKVVFDVIYFDYAPKLPTELAGPLSTIHVDHDLAPADGQVDASDSITITQP